MILANPYLLIFIIFFGITKGFINFDEEFVIFLCLFIVFVTLMETLGDIMNDYAVTKTIKIKSWYLINWNLNLDRIKNNSKLVFFNENFYKISFYFFITTLNSFLFFISYNFYLKQLYNFFLIKEILYIYELLELKTINKIYLYGFNKNKKYFLNSISKISNKFLFKTLKMSMKKIKK